MTGTKEYRAWKHIKGRCLNPADPAYRNYGARGITLAREWRDDPVAFVAHIGPAPEAKLTVERIDNDRGYEPGNVRWATRHDQTRNSRRNVRVVVAGRQMVLADACQMLGVDAKRIAYQIRTGAEPQQAIDEVVAPAGHAAMPAMRAEATA